MLTRISAALTLAPGGRTAWAVALLTLGAPTALWGALTFQSPLLADTLPVVPTVVQQYRHGSRDLSPYLVPPRGGRWEVVCPAGEDPYCVRPGRDGTGRYSSYPAGMEAFAWPVVLAAAALGADLDDDWNLFRLERVTASAAAGLCVALFFLAALRIGPPVGAWAAAALFATGSVVPSTLSQLLWQQTGTVACILAVLLVELSAAGRVGWRAGLVQAGACALMLACRPSAVTFLVPFGVWVLARDRRRGLLLPLAAGLLYLPCAVMYWSIYGTPFGPSMTFLKQTWTPAGNVAGVLFSPGRGVFVYQPWAWLALLLVAARVRRDPARPLPPGWYPFALATVACHVALVGSWGVWWGGYSWGSRLAAEAVAVIGLLAVRPISALTRTRAGLLLLTVLAAVGIVLHIQYTHGPGGFWDGVHNIDQHPEHLWDWQDPPFLFAEPK